MTAAKERMGKKDGGLARHSSDCKKGIDWETSRVLGVENMLRERTEKELNHLDQYIEQI